MQGLVGKWFRIRHKSEVGLNVKGVQGHPKGEAYSERGGSIFERLWSTDESHICRM